MSRVWNNGYGGQCCRRKKIINYEESDYCQIHHKEFLNNGKVKYGRIDEISPYRLSKDHSEPYKRCQHFKTLENGEKKQCHCRMSDNSEYCTLHSKEK